MKRLAFIFLLVCFEAGAAGSYGVGQRNFVFKDAARNRELLTCIWYPIAPETKLIPVGQEGNPFVSVVSAMDAPFPKSPAKFPVVLLSHGSGGKAEKLFWITDYLARNGVAVVAVNHKGNMTGDNSADGMMRVWDRPKDLSFALDRVLEQPDLKEKLDTSQIAAVGHSAGGTTVLLLAGAKLSHANLQSPIPQCEGTKDPWYAKLCEQMKTLDLKAYPKVTVEGDYSDPRVKAVVAYDPGLFRSFDPDTLKALKSKALVLIADKLNAPQDQIHSKEFSKVLPPSAAQVVPEAYHMTFLNACKPGFPVDDPELRELCINNDQKMKIQQGVAAKTLDFIQKHWAK